MHIFDAEPSVVRDLKDESKILVEKPFGQFTIVALRHPTMGKLVIVENPDGHGAVIETEQ